MKRLENGEIQSKEKGVDASIMQILWVQGERQITKAVLYGSTDSIIHMNIWNITTLYVNHEGLVVM